MIEVVPQEKTELYEEVKHAIWNIVQKHNINFLNIYDSKEVENAISAITHKLWFTMKNVTPELDEETLKHFKEFEKFEHEHVWVDAGESTIAGFEGKQTKTCECGAIVFENYLNNMSKRRDEIHEKRN
jgi:hypothetical protein